MEYRYTKQSLNNIQKRMVIKGIFNALATITLFSLYLFGVAWYFSLLPSLIFAALSYDFLSGTKRIEKYRDAMVIRETDAGLSISSYGIDSPFLIHWDDICIVKEKTQNGILTKFKIKTGDRFIKTREFANDIEGFSQLYKNLCKHKNT